MNENAFTSKDLYRIRAYLQQNITDGTVDITAVLSRIDNTLSSRNRTVKMSDQARQDALIKKHLAKERREVEKKLGPLEYGALCPECGSRRWNRDSDGEYEFIECKNCRYSMLIG